jgi:hypothetical protein
LDVIFVDLRDVIRGDFGEVLNDIGVDGIDLPSPLVCASV